jgi:hypothetical protein
MADQPEGTHQQTNPATILARQIDAITASFHQRSVVIDPVFGEAAKAYLRSLKGLPTIDLAGRVDDYFTAFSPLWRSWISVAPITSEQAWHIALAPVLAVEKEDGVRFHKGYVYYFLAIDAILRGDTDKGFLYMHFAFEEDQQTHETKYPSTPTTKFLTLSDAPDQFFRAWVQGRLSLLALLISDSNTRTGRSLSAEAFRQGFLANKDLAESVFLFLFCLVRMERCFGLVQDGQPATFSAQFVENVLFDLCLVIDGILHRLPGVEEKAMFQQCLAALRRDLNLQRREFQQIKTAGENDFAGTITGLLGETFPADRPWAGIDSAIAIAYVVRNRGAHTLHDDQVLAQRVGDVRDRILDVLFVSAEQIGRLSLGTPTAQN